MKKNSLASSVLQKIKSENIKPKPRWYFTFRNVLFWMLFVFSILLGSLAFSVIIFFLEQTDVSLLLRLRFSQLGQIISLLPLMWGTFFLGFLALSWWGWGHTEKGYKWSFVRLMGLNLLMSILLGGGFYITGGGENLEYLFSQKAPFYKSLEQRHKKMWLHPQEGRIMGQIKEIKDFEIFILQSPSQQIWEVDYQKTDSRSREFLKEGFWVKILGEKKEGDFFQAEIIRPFMMRRGNPKSRLGVPLRERKPLPPGEIWVQ